MDGKMQKKLKSSEHEKIPNNAEEWTWRSMVHVLAVGVNVLVK